MGALRHILYSHIYKTYPLIALLSPHSGVWGSKNTLLRNLSLLISTNKECVLLQKKQETLVMFPALAFIELSPAYLILSLLTIVI